MIRVIVDRKKIKIYPGFTMIELVLVMAIISILSVIFIPKYSDTLDELRLLNCSDKIIDDLKLIYNQAIVQHDSTWFVADTSANTYGIYSGSSALTRTLVIDPSTNAAQIVDVDDLFPGVSITNADFGGSLEFMFDWWGTPSSGGIIVLNDTDTIYVTAETGYVHND